MRVRFIQTRGGHVEAYEEMTHRSDVLGQRTIVYWTYVGTFNHLEAALEVLSRTHATIEAV